MRTADQSAKSISQHETYAARRETGKAARLMSPRESLAEFSAGPRDPLAILAENDEGRLPSLLPIRYERMAESSLAFLRGAAVLMADDLATQVSPGIAVQACGDCHLSNFGAFASPEGNVLFDIDDFDETLPDVDFTVDLKRLCASFAVAALDAGWSDEKARRIARRAAKAYRRHMKRLSRLSPLEAWHDRVELVREADRFGGALTDRLRALVSTARPDREEDRNFPHLSRSMENDWRIEDRPPLIFHVEEREDPAERLDLGAIFASCRDTLTPEVAALLRRYRLSDTAFKAVGVGSVGTFCAVGLFTTGDNDSLFLQAKEARASVLERLGDKARSWRGAQGQRVVNGQRVMQAASDLFLGWAVDRASGRHFYVRHLKNRRLGSISELIESEELPAYAKLCGRTLARAHARSADPALISGYMGKSEAFDDALASFAMLYAAQTKKDYALLLQKRRH